MATPGAIDGLLTIVREVDSPGDIEQVGDAEICVWTWTGRIRLRVLMGMRVGKPGEEPQPLETSHVLGPADAPFVLKRGVRFRVEPLKPSRVIFVERRDA